MSRIIQYTSQTDARANIAPRSGDTGIGSGLQEFARGVAVGGDAIIKRQEQTDLSSLNASLAQTQADLTTEWNEKLRTADPNDQNLAPDFLEEASKRIQAVGQSAKTLAGQTYFTEASARMSGQIQVNTAAGQAELAGMKARTDYVTALNGYSTAVYADPNSFAAALANHNQALEGQVLTGGMDRTTALQLQSKGANELAKSAVKGLIGMSPSAADKLLKSGAYDDYLDGADKDQLYGQIDAENRSRRVDAELADARNERARKQAQRQTENDWLARTLPGAENPLTAREVVQDPNVLPETKRIYMSLLEQDAKKPLTTTDASLFIDLFQKINLPEGDPNKITDDADLNQYLGKGLTSQSLGELRNEVHGKDTEQGKLEASQRDEMIKSVRSQLTRSNSLTRMADPKGDALFYGWYSDFTKNYQQQKKAGKTDAQLLRPDSPDFLGDPGRFKRTPQEIFKDLGESNAGLKIDEPGKLNSANDTPGGNAVPEGFTDTATNGKGETVYLVNGKWVTADGEPAK